MGIDVGAVIAAATPSSWFAGGWDSLDDAAKNCVRDKLKNVLRESSVSVKFNKLDGSTRVMRCTLVPDVIQPYHKKTSRVNVPSPDVCSVFDIEKNEWRSFRYDSVVHIEVI